MSIDIARAIDAPLSGPDYSWDEREVILYHLGIGAGADPVDPRELKYVYEGDLTPLPTFATIPPFLTMMSFGSVDGVDVSLAMVLHGEHEVVIHGQIPSSGTVTNQGRITHVYDRGKGAVIGLEIESRLVGTGEHLFTNRPSIFIRGEGGFGGDSGPTTRHPVPEREPDAIARSVTLPQQALLYRMASGDRNPLHVDPGFAGFAGYDRPILHGLCSYGVVAKAVVDNLLEGDVRQVRSFSARFAGVVFPGETIVTRMWADGSEVTIVAETLERGTPVISNGHMVRT